MTSECCVLSCSSKRSVVPHHIFPKNPERFRLWKSTVYSTKIENLSDEEIRKGIVCYKHFKDEDYIAGYKIRKLKPDAVPSLALPEGEKDIADAVNLRHKQKVREMLLRVQVFGKKLSRNRKGAESKSTI